MRKTNVLLILTIALAAVVCAPLSAAYVWKPTAFSEDMIQSGMGRLVAHPTDPETVFLATLNVPDLLSGGIGPADGLWVSRDRGQTWTTLNDGVFLPAYNISDLAICRSNPKVMYAATIQEGIFKTVDGGQSWTDAGEGFQYGGQGFPNTAWGVMAVAVDPANPDRVYISVAQVGELELLNLSPSHPGFFYSLDGGITWIENNGGLPARYDSIWDGNSRTAVAASIIVPLRKPEFVILGMADLHVNTALLFGKTAETRGRIFVNTSAGAGSFTEVSSGLPAGIKQGPEIGGSLARVSSSTMMLTQSTGTSVDIWASHVALTFDLNLSEMLMVTRNKGLYYTRNGSWQERNAGLPYIAYWQDNSSTSEATIRFEDTYNMGTVAVGTGAASRICLAGSNRCDMGNAPSNNTKVYASASSGLPAWMKDWDKGLDASPTYGYTEANASIIAFNADMTCAFATVRWSDDNETAPLEGDNGVYRLDIP